jgi:hypothetical protein
VTLEPVEGERIGRGSVKGELGLPGGIGYGKAGGERSRAVAQRDERTGATSQLQRMAVVAAGCWPLGILHYRRPPQRSMARSPVPPSLNVPLSTMPVVREQQHSAPRRPFARVRPRRASPLAQVGRDQGLVLLQD